MARDHTTLVIACAVAGGGWALLALGVLGGRLRARRRRAPHSTPRSIDGWQIAGDGLALSALSTIDAGEARDLLQRGLRSDEPDLRIAAITALGALGERYEWAVDGLIEALAEGIEDPVRVAAQLDRLAPRPGTRLVALLGHPNAVVRFYALRLLAGYPALVRRHAPDLTRDRSPHVRAAALDAFRAAASGEALRCALQLLDDPHPLVRSHAARAAPLVGGMATASFLLPLLADGSWWVREAAREALVALGRDVTAVVLPALEGEERMLRDGAALVLQDVGLVDDLVWGGSEPDIRQLEQILAAGGRRLRDTAAERARNGFRLGTSTNPAFGSAS
jgi:HEAT repeat protein